MEAGNPYESPRVNSADSEQAAVSFRPSLLLWSLATVFVSAMLGGLLGLLIGLALGSLVPGYYRSVFANGNEEFFDPVAVGIGQGLTQGVVFGGVVGLVLVALFYWRRSRLQ